MYFAYDNRSTYEEEHIEFIKKIKFADGGELAIVYNNGSYGERYDDDEEYDSDKDNYVFLKGDGCYTCVTNGYNILLVGSSNRYVSRWNEEDFGESGLSPKMMDFFQQLYKTMSLGTSVVDR